MTSPSTTQRKGSGVWAVGLGLVVVMGVVAVLLARGSGDDPVSGQTGDVEIGGPAAGAEDATTADTSVEGPDTNSSEASAAALPPFVDPLDDPAVGMTLPTVSGTTLEGDAITIGPDGSAKVIVFLAHWCPVCQREVPVIADYLESSPPPDGVDVVSVSTRVEPSADNYPPQVWLDEAGWPVPALADSEDDAAAAAYGLSAVPFFVVVDDEGQVVVRVSGELDAQQLDALVGAADSGRPPA